MQETTAPELLELRKKNNEGVRESIIAEHTRLWGLHTQRISLSAIEANKQSTYPCRRVWWFERK